MDNDEGERCIRIERFRADGRKRKAEPGGEAARSKDQKSERRSLITMASIARSTVFENPKSYLRGGKMRDTLSGPVEFGRAELNRAAAERGLRPVTIKVEISGGRPECFVVAPEKITGGDERGLMYGLLEAAEQIHQTGHIGFAQGQPATAIRGIRYFIHNESMDRNWYYSKEYWNAYFAMLARNRLNRFNLVFASQTNYLAPPYPFWVRLPEFPEIKVPGLSEEQRSKNIKMLCYISQSAAEHGVDFTLGVWQHNAWAVGQTPTVSGISEKNIGPYTYAALKKVLQECSALRSVQIRTGIESGIPRPPQQLSFYRDWVFRALREAGRPVTLDLRGWDGASAIMDAAAHVGVPLRVSAKYWAENMGRPYQPVETFSAHSYQDFLKKSRPYGFYWEVWALGSHRLLLWGDPEYVRRAAPTFSLSGSIGFEIDAPFAQKGFGNGPGQWGIFANNRYVSHKDKKFWHWEFERYWMFYLLWGRLTYDPSASKDVWMGELRQRFGQAAPDVLVAYQTASRILSEIVAAHVADPNMYIWPEINPGGLIGEYKDIAPSDQSFIASPAEAAYRVLRDTPSAKQGPHETAQLFDHLASEVEAAVGKAATKLKDNTEWRGTEPDLQVLAHLARYHARKREAAYSLSWFYETGNLAALDHAEVELVAALDVWKDLVALTDGLYPDQMIFGPVDFGHWKDKLPYIYNDLSWVRELKEVQQRYGSYEFRFQFGSVPLSPVPHDFRNGTFRWAGEFINRNAVEPRFTVVDPRTIYSDQTGYGWGYGPYGGTKVVDSRYDYMRRRTPPEEVRTQRARPEQLPENVLFKGFLSIQGATFRVRTGDGTFEVVILDPNHSETRETVSAQRGVLNIAFPADRSQDVSALLIRNQKAKPMVSEDDERYPRSIPRPDFVHIPSQTATEGQPLELSIRVTPDKNVKSIRLHYRSLNAFEEVHTQEVSGSSASFTIPTEAITGDYDLLYYFEVLNDENGGWFYPDPAVTTPYYVVTVQNG